MASLQSPSLFMIKGATPAVKTQGTGKQAETANQGFLKLFANLFTSDKSASLASAADTQNDQESITTLPDGTRSFVWIPEDDSERYFPFPSEMAFSNHSFVPVKGKEAKSDDTESVSNGLSNVAGRKTNKNTTALKGNSEETSIRFAAKDLTETAVQEDVSETLAPDFSMIGMPNDQEWKILHQEESSEMIGVKPSRETKENQIPVAKQTSPQGQPIVIPVSGKSASPSKQLQKDGIDLNAQDSNSIGTFNPATQTLVGKQSNAAEGKQNIAAQGELIGDETKSAIQENPAFTQPSKNSPATSTKNVAEAHVSPKQGTFITGQKSSSMEKIQNPKEDAKAQSTGSDNLSAQGIQSEKKTSGSVQSARTVKSVTNQPVKGMKANAETGSARTNDSQKQPGQPVIKQAASEGNTVQTVQRMAETEQGVQPSDPSVKAEPEAVQSETSKNTAWKPSLKNRPQFAGETGKSSSNEQTQAQWNTADPSSQNDVVHTKGAVEIKTDASVQAKAFNPMVMNNRPIQTESTHAQTNVAIKGSQADISSSLETEEVKTETNGSVNPSVSDDRPVQAEQAVKTAASSLFAQNRPAGIEHSIREEIAALDPETAKTIQSVHVKHSERTNSTPILNKESVQTDSKTLQTDEIIRPVSEKGISAETQTNHKSSAQSAFQKSETPAQFNPSTLSAYSVNAAETVLSARELRLSSPVKTMRAQEVTEAKAQAASKIKTAGSNAQAAESNASKSQDSETSASIKSFAASDSVPGTAQTPASSNPFQQAAAVSAKGESTPVRTEIPVIEQIVPRIQQMLKDGETVVRMTLQPKELGEVRIEIVSDKESMRAQIIVETREAQALMKEAMPELKAVLENQNITLPQIAVNVAQEVMADGQRENAREARTNNRGSRGRKDSTDDKEKSEPVLSVSRSLGNHTIEYVA